MRSEGVKIHMPPFFAINYPSKRIARAAEDALKARLIQHNKEFPPQKFTPFRPYKATPTEMADYLRSRLPEEFAGVRAIAESVGAGSFTVNVGLALRALTDEGIAESQQVNIQNRNRTQFRASQE